MKKNKQDNVHRIVSLTSVSKAAKLLKPPIKKKAGSDAKLNKKNKPNCLASFNEARCVSKAKHEVSPANMYIVLREMRNALIKQDWQSVQEYFLCLGRCPYMIYLLEPGIWRTAFLILINSPMSNISHFFQFIEQTTGCSPEVLEEYLEKFVKMN